MLVRRSDFEKVGGFCEEYYYCYEDIDLCLKIKSLKKTIVYTPEARLIHAEGISSNKNNNSKLQENINAFRTNCVGKYFNDLEFYLQNQNHMVYKAK
jgi:GT2 family glycosyltransferase